MRRTALLVLVSVLACLLFADMAAAADIGFMGIGGRLGYVKPEDPIDGTFNLGVVVNLGTIVPALQLEGSVDYWSKSYETSYMGWSGSEWTYSDLMIGATAKYMIPTQSTVSPFVGGGLAMHMFSWEWKYEYTDPYFGHVSEKCDDSQTDIGFHAVGGVEMELSPNLRGGLEARYAIADPDHFGIFGTITYILKP